MTITPAPEPEEETAAEWVARLAAELALEPIGLRTQAAVLALAREVARGTERKYAPLASFVAGRYVQRVAHEGRDVDAALRDVTAAVVRLLDAPATR